MKRIVIVDDDHDSRESLAIIAEDAGFKPEIIIGRYGNDKERLIDEILCFGAEGVISDHRLQNGQMASFFGADLLAALYDRNIPSVLITQFYDEDADSSIRQFRDKIPSVIGRGSQTPQLFQDLLTFSKNELAAARDVTRKPHRALIRLENFKAYMSEGLAEGIVTNW
jgi:DNA-binding NtrC family response regulator